MAELTTYLIILFLGFFGLSAALNLLFLRLADRKQVKSITKADRWAPSKPTSGGVAIFFTLVAGWLIWGFLLESPFQSWEWKLVAATCLAFAMGRYDDLRSVRPFYKLVFQVACALLVVDASHALPIFQDWELLRIAVSVFWVVAIMNAVNMLDNMDAISGGVGMLIAFGLGLGSWWMLGDWTFVSLTMIALGCAMLGFLLFNWHPSKLYMGDAGSMTLGLLLASGGITVFGNAEVQPSGFSFVMLLLLFATPLLDTTLVVVNRLIARSSPAKGGKDHSTHQLAYLGLKERSVAGIFLALCATQTFLALYMLVTPKLHTYTILSITVLYMCIHFISLWWISRNNLQKDKYSY